MRKLLPDDFKEFLKLCNRKRVKYLLIGGYAVVVHGYPRTTADMDVWIELSPENAERMVDVLIEFGFDVPELSAKSFLAKGTMVRMGVSPFRLEIFNQIAGVSFAQCYRNREQRVLNGIKVDVISRRDLIKNKRASGRPKDLDDVEHL